MMPCLCKVMWIRHLAGGEKFPACLCFEASGDYILREHPCCANVFISASKAKIVLRDYAPCIILMRKPCRRNDRKE